jgi:alpha-tubulin suppressor-like RCC1 family protein
MINFFVDLHRKVVDAAIGKYHSCAVTDDGKVYTWGSAGLLSLVLGRVASRSLTALGRQQEYASEPTLVELPDSCTQVAVGNAFTVALSAKGQLFGWGKFRNGPQ